MSDFKKRKGFWDDEEEESVGVTNPTSNPFRNEKSGQFEPTHDWTRQDGSGGGGGGGDFESNLGQASVLLQQVHQLYLSYFNGVEKRPPGEKLLMLEKLITQIEAQAVEAAAARFRVQQIKQQFQTYKDLWDRKLKELEK